jgi:hypothetical protein
VSQVCWHGGATLHAAAYGNSLDVSTRQKLESLRTQGKIELDILRKGPAEDWPHANIEELIEYARTFPKKVASNTGNAWTIEYITRDYDQLLNRTLLTEEQIKFYDS